MTGRLKEQLFQVPCDHGNKTALLMRKISYLLPFKIRSIKNQIRLLRELEMLVAYWLVLCTRAGRTMRCKGSHQSLLVAD